MTGQDSLIPVLENHRFDEGSLNRYLEQVVDDYQGPLTVRQFQGGMSNPTFQLTDGAGRRYVMRKKPPGKLLPSAHAVDREYRVISALADTDVPVAKTYTLCEDATVIGQAFYVMDYVEGRVFRRIDLPGVKPEERGAIFDAMNDVLAKLHQVDFRAVGLGDFGREGGYVDRQIRRWTKSYEATKTEALADMDRLIDWLPANIPDEDETTIAHGDYRLENMIFHPAEAKVLAVIDWELCTLGHPLSDLAYNCLVYHYGDDNRGDISAIDYAAHGIPTEPEYVDSYRRRTGRKPIANWDFYIVLSLFRLGAIAQGVYARGLAGNASSPEALKRKDTCRKLAKLACDLL
jgi:aminoglycoside phosphotransferase (APT) family kinase protein